ncbi:MAG TPA: trigger factor [Candidatus Brocadiales bacterium]|nr:trigger factor [Candidatus Brocadiales bacterium]
METAEINVQIEEVGPCKKLLKIEVPKENVETEWEKRFDEVCRVAELPGFRKGRAPKKLVEKRFGEQIKEDVKQSVVSDSYQKAIEKNDINPIGLPEFSDIDFDPGKPLNFKVTLEVKPTFSIENYRGIRLIRKSSTVTDKEIEKALTNIAVQKAQLIVVEDGKIGHTDHVICDCQVKIGKDVIWQDSDIEILASNPLVTGVDAPGLASDLVEMSSGKQCEVSVKLVDAFSVEEHRGKNATLVLTIKEIKRPKVPKIDDELAKQFDFDSLDELKKHLHERLEREKQAWVQQNLTSQLYEKLFDMANFDLPKDLIARQSERRLRRYQLDLLYKGTPVDKIRKETEYLKNASEESVIRDVKLSFILEQIADKEKLYTTEADIENRIVEMANAHRTTPAKLRRQLEKDGDISNLRYTMREEKVINLLMKDAVLEDEEKMQ